jgi:hypothetical protein
MKPKHAFTLGWLAVDASAPCGQAAPINISERRSQGRAMKLMWFHPMPYTELPDDFRQQHPSVSVDIHSSLFDPLRAHRMYNDFMDELEFAAEWWPRPMAPTERAALPSVGQPALAPE